MSHNVGGAPFILECAPEAFRRRIVITIPFATHRALHAKLIQQLAVIMCAILESNDLRSVLADNKQNTAPAKYLDRNGLQNFWGLGVEPLMGVASRFWST